MLTDSIERKGGQMQHVPAAVLDRVDNGHEAFTRISQPVRYRYSKKGINCFRYVIVDVYPDGYEEFSEQEAGEVCWYRYLPGTSERVAFHTMIDEDQNKGRWPLLRF